MRCQNIHIVEQQHSPHCRRVTRTASSSSAALSRRSHTRAPPRTPRRRAARTSSRSSARSSAPCRRALVAPCARDRSLTPPRSLGTPPPQSGAAAGLWCGVFFRWMREFDTSTVRDASSRASFRPAGRLLDARLPPPPCCVVRATARYAETLIAPFTHAREEVRWFDAAAHCARSNLLWDALYTSIGDDLAVWHDLFEVRAANLARRRGGPRPPHTASPKAGCVSRAGHTDGRRPRPTDPRPAPRGAASSSREARAAVGSSVVGEWTPSFVGFRLAPTPRSWRPLPRDGASVLSFPARTGCVWSPDVACRRVTTRRCHGALRGGARGASVSLSPLFPSTPLGTAARPQGPPPSPSSCICGRAPPSGGLAPRVVRAALSAWEEVQPFPPLVLPFGRRCSPPPFGGGLIPPR